MTAVPVPPDRSLVHLISTPPLHQTPMTRTATPPPSSPYLTLSMYLIVERIIDSHPRPLRHRDLERLAFAKSLTVPRQPRTVPKLRHLIGPNTACGPVAGPFAEAITVTAGCSGTVSFKTRPVVMSEVKRRREVGLVE